MRALPLMSIAQEPQISSRQFESYVMGVVFFPSRVTGFSAMSRRQMMTFIEGRQFRENSSQRAGSLGPACRFTFTMAFFVSAMHPQANLATTVSLEERFLVAAPASAGRLLTKTNRSGWSLRGVVSPRARLNQRNVHRLVGQLDVAIDPLRARRLQPVGVIAVRELRLVVRAARFVASQRTQCDHARQNQHVFQFSGQMERFVRQLR